MSVEAIRRPFHAGLIVEAARSVASLALARAGCTLAAIGEAMGRTPAAANLILARARRKSTLAGRAASILAEVRGAGAGDVVMVPIVVGSEAWRYLDRLSELDEVSANVIRHHGIVEMLAAVCE